MIKLRNIKNLFLIIVAIISISAVGKDLSPEEIDAIEVNNRNETARYEKFLNSLRPDDIVNGWKIVKFEKEDVGPFNTYRVTFKGNLKAKIKYFHYVAPDYEIGPEENIIIFYYSDKDKKALPYYVDEADFSDKSFSSKIADSSYGTMEVLIDEVFLVFGENDVDYNYVNVSKVLSFKEEGRLNYGKNGEFADKANKELDNFIKKKF